MFENLRKLLMGLALSGFLGCPGPTPPTPPTPTPPPPPQPIAQEMLLTAHDGKIFKGPTPVDAFMAVPCCMPSPEQVGNARWPLASESWMDYVRPYGANFVHFRMGPFLGDVDHEIDWSDTGGPYVTTAGEFNPKFWAKVVELANHAAENGIWVEVNVIDTWYCKHAQWGDQPMPWLPADIDACGRRSSDEQDRYIRKVVAELGKFGNVVWLTDNEGGEIEGTQRAWYEWVVGVIRDEEQKSGFGLVHIIGTNNTDFGDVADYVADHSRRQVNAIAGRWTINNERNPAFSPEQEAAMFKAARDQGLAWAFWRAEMDEASMLETLNRFRDIIQGGNEPGCFPPAEDDPRWGTPVSAADRHCQMCGQIDLAKDAVGSTCGQDPISSLDRFGAQLRKQGLCAGRSADSVFVLANDGLWEEHHVIAYTTGCYTMTQNGYKNAWPYANPNVPVEGCPPPLPTGGVDKWTLVKHNNLFDCTPKTCDREYCAAIGSDQICCPARLEGDPNRVACERYMIGGDPVWRGDGEILPTDNPFQVRCPSCTWIEVCNVALTVCERLEIN